MNRLSLATNAMLAITLIISMIHAGDQQNRIAKIAKTRDECMETLDRSMGTVEFLFERVKKLDEILGQ